MTIYGKGMMDELNMRAIPPAHLYTRCARILRFSACLSPHITDSVRQGADRDATALEGS